jgi:hypothetical protein
MAAAILLAYLAAALSLFTGLWMIFQHRDGRACSPFFMWDLWEEVEEGGLDGYVSEYGECPYELYAILSFVASLLWMAVGSMGSTLFLSRGGRFNTDDTTRDRGETRANEETMVQEQPAQV